MMPFQNILERYNIDKILMSNRLENLSNTLNKDNRILELRRTSKIDKQELFQTIFPYRISQHFEDVYNLIRDNAHIFLHPDIEQLNKAEQRRYGMLQALTIIKNLRLNLEEDQYKFIASWYALASFGMGTAVKSLVHYIVYIKTLVAFQNNHYHREFIDDTHNQLFNYIGSFGLTQLHHGSFSRGIATEAVYDHKTKEFVLNSKGEQGMKFWIGALASTANMTITWAQLIIDGVNYGPHAFLMQIRDFKTHQVLPGVKIGDCGPKNALDAIDNGYLILKNVRIPKKSLLNKLGDIDEDGKYQSKIKSNKQRFGLHMSPLSSGRANFAFIALSQSTAALTIAIRYACIRRQFKVDHKKQETLIMDYPITRHRLMVPLASTIVYYFSGILIAMLYIENADNFTDPTKKIVGQLHATSAVLKAKATWFTIATITECRQILGGHGYSSFSRLGKYYHENDINSTWQGDNSVLLQQTSKYLLKTIAAKQRGAIVNLQFVHNGPHKIEYNEESLNNIASLKLMVQNNFIVRYQTALRELSRIKQSMKGSEKMSKQILESEAWDRLQPYFANEMALAYGDIIYFDTMHQVLEDIKGPQHNIKFLETCLKVWAQNLLLKSSVEDVNCRKILQNLIIKGCELIYPDCIAVTDAIAPPNYVIGSPFSQQDGEGMKDYINMVFTGKKTFGRVPWFEKIIKLKQQQG